MDKKGFECFLNFNKMSSKSEKIWSKVAEIIQHDERDLKEFSGALFHYTNSNGLVGILGSQRLWGTNSGYLNDPTEFSYGVEVAKAVLHSFLQSNISPGASGVIDETIKSLQTLDDEIYIASLSESGDLLSQWKGYANYGAGYSVEFDASQLLRTHRKHPNFQIAIRKVIYDRGAQDHIFNKLLADFSELIHESNSDEKLIVEIAHALGELLRFQSLFCKHPSFAEEREWRVALWDRPFSGENGRLDVKFRVAGDLIVPYIEMDIGPSAQKSVWHLPISKIIVGSKIDLERAKMSIGLMCEKKKIPLPQIKMSKVPLR